MKAEKGGNKTVDKKIGLYYYYSILYIKVNNYKHIKLQLKQFPYVSMLNYMNTMVIFRSAVAGQFMTKRTEKTQRKETKNGQKNQ